MGLPLKCLFTETELKANSFLSFFFFQPKYFCFFFFLFLMKRRDSML